MTRSAPSSVKKATDRLTVRFDCHNVAALISRGPNAGKPIGTVLEYVEADRKTPTGGDYKSRKFTLRTPDGRKWYGTVPKDSDIVRCRLAS